MYSLETEDEDPVTQESQNSAWALVSLACGVGRACLSLLEWLLPGLCTCMTLLLCVSS